MVAGAGYSRRPHRDHPVAEISDLHNNRMETYAGFADGLAVSVALEGATSSSLIAVTAKEKRTDKELEVCPSDHDVKDDAMVSGNVTCRFIVIIYSIFHVGESNDENSKVGAAPTRWLHSRPRSLSSLQRHFSQRHRRHRLEHCDPYVVHYFGDILIKVTCYFKLIIVPTQFCADGGR